MLGPYLCFNVLMLCVTKIQGIQAELSNELSSSAQSAVCPQTFYNIKKQRILTWAIDTKTPISDWKKLSQTQHQ